MIGYNKIRKRNLPVRGYEAYQNRINRKDKFMKYISGIHALNLSCSLETGGDWHTSGLQWSNIKLLDSDNMFFKEYGIESNRTLPGKFNSEKYNVANHIRAILDLLELGQFTIAQGMNNDYICNEKYDNEIFLKVYSMNKLQNWNQIDAFMKREYRSKWLNFKEKMKIKNGRLENRT